MPFFDTFRRKTGPAADDAAFFIPPDLPLTWSGILSEEREGKRKRRGRDENGGKGVGKSEVLD